MPCSWSYAAPKTSTRRLPGVEHLRNSGRSGGLVDFLMVLEWFLFFLLVLLVFLMVLEWFLFFLLVLLVFLVVLLIF